MDWDDVRHFLALARAGSVRAAGLALGVSHSTVARRVEALEARLAARLFDRSRDGWSLTAAGARMVPVAERIERELAALELGLLGTDERLEGPVALTCSDPFVAGFLLRELAAFCARHPAIAFHVDADGRPLDLDRREADIAVRALRLGVSPPAHLIGARIAPVVLCSYVATAHATSLDPSVEGSAPRWLAFDDGAVQDEMIATSGHPDLPPWGRFATLELMVRAAREGYGLVMLPTYVGDPDPALRRLARAAPRHLADLWLVSHPDLRTNARFKATREAIAAAFERHGALFRGEG